MPGKAAKVTVTEKQWAVLSELSRSRSEPGMIVQRASIILRAFEGRRNEEIAPEVRLNAKQVGVWRRRWQAAWEALTVFECTEPRKLREAVRDTLRDAPRPGAPPTFTPEQVAQIVAVACEPPELSGRPITHWTQAELRDEILKRGIVESISVTRVGEFLRQAALQPHRRKIWLNTKEQDPEVFQRQVETVCAAYRQAPELAAEGGHTVCIDEMTGLQALERIAPDHPMIPGHPQHQEFEYARHGTTTLIGSFDVAGGEMLPATLGPTRTEEDFVAHIAGTVAHDPGGEWVFLVDQLNIHWSAGLVEFVAEKCEPDRPLGKKGRLGNSQKPSQPSGVSV